MSLKKETAIQDVLSHFEDFANLLLHQLDLLEGVLSSGQQTIPKEILKEIKQNEEKLDHFEIKMSQKIINTIVLHQPMATDLRKIIACYRMIVNLERIGDLVYNIVNFVDRIKDPDIYLNLSDVISNMLISSSSMVKKALLSFTNNDKEYAIWTIKNDSVIDEMNHKLLKKAISRSKMSEETQRMLFSFIGLKGIISNIERIADHATNIAEASIYALEGTDIRHQELEEGKK